MAPHDAIKFGLLIAGFLIFSPYSGTNLNGGKTLEIRFSCATPVAMNPCRSVPPGAKEQL